MIWYTGEAGTDDPRSTALARVDQSLAVAYGMRANEEGLRTAVQSIAVFAATTFSAADPDAREPLRRAQAALGAALIGSPNEQKITDIQGELAGAQLRSAAPRTAISRPTARWRTCCRTSRARRPEEVAAQILALQTSLQATLQTTAMLLQTTLLEYL